MTKVYGWYGILGVVEVFWGAGNIMKTACIMFPARKQDDCTNNYNVYSERRGITCGTLNESAAGCDILQQYR